MGEWRWRWRMAMALVCGGFIAHIVGPHVTGGVGIKKAAHAVPHREAPVREPLRFDQRAGHGITMLVS